MSALVIAVLLVKMFLSGTAVGVWLERRSIKREELARVSLRLRRYANHGAE